MSSDYQVIYEPDLGFSLHIEWKYVNCVKYVISQLKISFSFG